jgi:hypothetical protein
MRDSISNSDDNDQLSSIGFDEFLSDGTPFIQDLNSTGDDDDQMSAEEYAEYNAYLDDLDYLRSLPSTADAITAHLESVEAAARLQDQRVLEHTVLNGVTSVVHLSARGPSAVDRDGPAHPPFLEGPVLGLVSEPARRL